MPQSVQQAQGFNNQSPNHKDDVKSAIPPLNHGTQGLNELKQGIALIEKHWHECAD